jgi:hypothetical protein
MEGLLSTEKICSSSLERRPLSLALDRGIHAKTDGCQTQSTDQLTETAQVTQISGAKTLAAADPMDSSA